MPVVALNAYARVRETVARSCRRARRAGGTASIDLPPPTSSRHLHTGRTVIMAIDGLIILDNTGSVGDHITERLSR